MTRLRALLRRTWLCVELREMSTPLPTGAGRIVSRHWTWRRAVIATELAEESWRNACGEVRAGRARWDDATGQVRRFTRGIRPEPKARMAELASLPNISYFPMPIEDAGELTSGRPRTA